MQDLSHEHHVKFNTPVGDKDENGNYVDRQFVYYPELKVLETDGGVGTESEMRDESIAIGNGVLVTAESEDELLRWWWSQTAEQRAHHDAIFAQEKPPPLTVDGNPPVGEMNQDSEPTIPGIESGQFSENGNGMPKMEAQRQPQQQPFEPEMPTVVIELESFTEMQRQLIIGEYKPLLDLQDMVIQTQAILLRNLLDPDSPHHEVIETWMTQLETLRQKND